MPAHHTAATTGRIVLTRTARNLQRRAKARAAGVAPRTQGNSCGTIKKYWQGCRCEACEAKHQAKLARQRHKDAHRLTEYACGTAKGYYRNGCRCALCCAAREQHVQDCARRAGRSADASTGPITQHWPFERAVADLDPLTATIQAAVPRNLPEHIRQEACQDLAIVLMTGGQLSPATVAATVREAWKLAPGGRRHVSLDASMPGHDRDSREHWIDQLPDMAAIEWLQSAGATRAHA